MRKATTADVPRGSSSARERNLASPFPGNVPSEAIEVTSTSEFGGQVEFAGPSLTTTNVTVAMSSWACQSGGAEDGSCVSAAGAKFEWPVTLHIYTVGAGNAVGTQVAGLTKTFKDALPTVRKSRLHR